MVNGEGPTTDFELQTFWRGRSAPVEHVKG